MKTAKTVGVVGTKETFLELYERKNGSFNREVLDKCLKHVKLESDEPALRQAFEASVKDGRSCASGRGEYCFTGHFLVEKLIERIEEPDAAGLSGEAANAILILLRKY